MEINMIGQLEHFVWNFKVEQIFVPSIFETKFEANQSLPCLDQPEFDQISLIWKKIKLAN